MIAVILQSLTVENTPHEMIRQKCKKRGREAVFAIRHLCYALQKVGCNLQRPDSLFEVPGFTFVRVNRDKDSAKSKGGRMCVYINDNWCQVYSMKCKICDPNIEILGMTLRLFYPPREFG